MKKATIIIPNYNGLHFLKDCLAALSRQDTDDFDVCVVDNGSVDGSAEWLKEKEPQVQVIALEKNTGFCHAVNAGVKAAETPYVILLNNDTIPKEGFVSALISAMEKHKKAFACASCMLTAKDETILDGAGDLYSAFGWAFARGQGEKAGNYQEPAEVFSACGGAAIYRREEFIRLGLLDEVHFAYLEDMDLCWRAKLAGWKNLYVPEAKVVHIGSGTTGSRHNEFKVRMSARNNIYMIRKNMAPWQKVLNAPLLAAGTLLKLLYFRKKGLGGAYTKGLRQGAAIPVQKTPSGAFSALFAIQLELWINLLKRKHV